MKKLLLLSSISLILAACGGGGTDQTTSTSALDKYVGVWKGPCLGNLSNVVQASDNGKTNGIETLEFTKLSATELNTKLTTSYYATSDTTCSNASIGSVTITGENTGTESFSASGVTSSLGKNPVSFTKEVTLATGEKVDQLVITTAPLSSTNATVTAGAIRINTADFPGSTSQAIVYFKNATQFVINADDTYPTVLDQDPDLLYTKQ